MPYITSTTLLYSTIGLMALIVFGVIINPVHCFISDSFLATQLFEVGGLWTSALSNTTQNLLRAVHLQPDWTSPLTYLYGAVALVLFYLLYWLLFAPIDRIRFLGDVGYVPESNRLMKDMVNIVRKRRLVGDIPPVYPNGWFVVMETRDLKVGEVKNVGCLGKNLAVFRGDNGRSHVIDAYCPHMGANLAVGGLVKGDCLECPFHGWKFRGDDGKCVHIPYIDEQCNIPDKAKVTSYVTIERNGFIYMWFHAEGAEPTWEPPEIEEIANGEWTYRGRSEHIINAHIEEIPENGADVAHLSHLHGPIMTAGVDLRYTYSKLWSFAKHAWIGQWNQHPDPDKKHVGLMDLSHSVKLFDYNFSLLDLKVVAHQIGPGIVNLTFDSPLFGRGAYLQVLTPIEPLTQRMVHHIYANRYIPTFVAKFFLYAEALMVERDITIWNNKRYLSKPMFVKSKEDSLVAKHRRWYAQFYTENSPRLKFQSDSLDW